VRYAARAMLDVTPVGGQLPPTKELRPEHAEHAQAARDWLVECGIASKKGRKYTRVR